MSGWKILTARRTDSTPTADAAERAVSDATDAPVTAWERDDVLHVVHHARDSSPLKALARRHTDSLSLVAIASANDTDDSASAQFYTPENGTLESIPGASHSVGVDGRHHARFTHDGLTARVNP